MADFWSVGPECYNGEGLSKKPATISTMFQRLQVQLTILFATFVLLVVVSVGVTYWGLQTQRQDALVLNLAGRQRMLVQQMTRLALQWKGGDETVLAALQESEQIFSQTLFALRNGGPAPYLTDDLVELPITRDPQLLAALDEVDSAWTDYRSMLKSMTSAALGPGLLEVTLEERSDDLVQRADVVVRLYETASTAKVERLRSIQVIFLACALALLATGAWLMRRSLL